MAKAVRGQPVKPRPQVGPPPGSADRNYFASVVDELRKVVWPTWNELGRMTGVVVTTVILMAVIISAADYGLGLVVKQLYQTATPTAAPSQIKRSVASPNPRPSSSASITTAPPTSAGGTTAPVTP